MKNNILTISIANKGHGTFARQVRMAIALCKKGYKVYWICPEIIKFNKNIHHIKLMFNFIPNFFFIGLFIKIFLTSLFNLTVFLNINKIFVVREYDGLALFYNPFLTKAKRIFFSRGDVISILKINLNDQKIYKKIIHIITIKIYPYFQKILNLRVDVYIFQQVFLKKLYFNRINKPNKKIFILNNNCLDLSRIKNKTFENQHNVKVGFSTPMFWSCKGLDNIIKIINCSKKNYPINYLIAGDGPNLDLLKNKIDPLSINKIIFLGWQNNIINFLKKIDILIVPSNFDSNPNMVLEALSCEKIVLATNIDAHRAILKNKELLFNKNNIKLLYEKLFKIKNNLIYRKKIFKIIKEIKFKNTFDWDNYFYKIIEKC
jgi:hypothetical protein